MLVEPEFVSHIVEMYQAGANQKQIVEELGVSYNQCRYWLKKRGLYDPKRRIHNTVPAQDYNQEQHRQALEEFLSELHDSGFDYLGGYEIKYSRVYIRCLSCGAIFQRTRRNWTYHWTYQCPECGLHAEEFRMKRLYKRQIERISFHIRSRMFKRQKERKEQEWLAKEYHRLYDAHICVWCNKIFTIKEYEDREGKRNVNTLSHCSIECKEQHKKFVLKKSNRAHGHHRKRARKYGVEYIPGITLEKLIKRDGLTCALCGGQCDWNDKRYGDCGPNYPSIDHIIPISKGGSHTWENVQVAHFNCNSSKNNRVDCDYSA